MPVASSDIAIVVPVGGAGAAWPRAAASLARLDPPPGALVVVVDGPSERLERVAADIGATTVVLDERGGPARARNQGVASSTEPIVLFLDADVEVPADLVARVAAAFTAEPALSAVFGSYDAQPADPHLVSQYRNLLHHAVHQAAHEEATTFWAGCGAVRRQAFDAVGGFDGAWVEPSIEDIELGTRLTRAGCAIRIEKALQVKHLKRWRLGEMVATDLWRRAVPWTALMLRGGQLVNDLNVKTRDRVSVMLAFAALAALPLAWWWPGAVLAALGSLALVVWLNADLFGLFARLRGWRFAVGTLPLHWLYLLTCGAGFAIGAAHALRRR
jgi:GT2 family glycosyltransferase